MPIFQPRLPLSDHLTVLSIQAAVTHFSRNRPFTFGQESGVRLNSPNDHTTRRISRAISNFLVNLASVCLHSECIVDNLT